MLRSEDNEFLARTGPATTMGDLLRRFWLPFLLAEELPAPDCPPVRVKLMGEELVAFRDSQGRVGLIDQFCPHRRASLFFGRNEENGLRCVYHGWKYDAEGRCVDMPNEPAESSFKHKVRITSYQTREWGGLIWAYMGPSALVPELPQLEWARVPESHRYISRRLEECNYLQAVEGGIDTVHAVFLHKRQTPQRPGWTDYRARKPDSSKWYVKRTDYGLLIGARFDADEDTYYWRLTQWLMPFYTMIPRTPGEPISGHVWVPIDDDNCWVFTYTWHPDRPLTAREVANIESWTGIHVEVLPGTHRPVRNKANDYQIDRTLQRSYSYTGIKAVGEQDQAVQESMGRMVDRSKEHLGTTDSAIIAMRRILIKAARDLKEGKEPSEAHNGDAYRVRSADAVLKRGIPFDEGAKELLVARA